MNSNNNFHITQWSRDHARWIIPLCESYTGDFKTKIKYFVSYISPETEQGRDIIEKASYYMKKTNGWDDLKDWLEDLLPNEKGIDADKLLRQIKKTKEETIIEFVKRFIKKAETVSLSKVEGEDIMRKIKLLLPSLPMEVRKDIVVHHKPEDLEFTLILEHVEKYGAWLRFDNEFNKLIQSKDYMEVDHVDTHQEDDTAIHAIISNNKVNFGQIKNIMDFVEAAKHLFKKSPTFAKEMRDLVQGEKKNETEFPWRPPNKNIPKCFNCGKPGHIQRDCRVRRSQQDRMPIHHTRDWADEDTNVMETKSDINSIRAENSGHQNRRYNPRRAKIATMKTKTNSGNVKNNLTRKLLHVSINLNEKSRREETIIDTGASGNILPASVCQRHNLVINNKNRVKLTGFSEKGSMSTGTVILPVKVGPWKKEVSFIVSSETSKIILGMPFLANASLKVNCEEGTLEDTEGFSVMCHAVDVHRPAVIISKN